MKKLITLTISFLFCFSASANIITVSNNLDSPGMYTDLQTAIDDALDGDTLLIAGSPTNYGSITIDKKLRLVGAGIAPGYRQSTYTSIITTITLNTNISGQGASGTRLE